MAKKLDHMDLKQIIRLHLEATSNRRIADTLGISRNTVNQYMNLFQSMEVPFEEILELNEGDIQELFPIKTTIDNQRYDTLMKYFEKVHKASYYTGFTFLYHYEEYASQIDNPYSYTQFMEHYNRKYNRVKGSMKLEHKAGEKLMIDFAGKHLYITDKATGEQRATEVFVAILPCSQYTYIEACMSQKREDLISCIAHALSYIGGVSKAIISDNLKSAVTRASKYEPQINRSLKDFAVHYGCVINPARSYSPQDKALVENAVHLAYQRIFHPLREMVFFSLEDLNRQIRLLLESYNDYLFQRKEASRKELFQSIERQALCPLPGTAFEIKDYRRAKVQKIGYVFFSPDKTYYSVPYRYIGKQTQIHYTGKVVEIYYNHQRIALHRREKCKGTYITVKDHLSSSHQAYSDWSPKYFKKLAIKHGKAVMKAVEILIEGADYPEVGYKKAMGVIQLHREYSSERLNNACQRAINGDAVSYHRIKNILKNNMDKEDYLPDFLNRSTSHIPEHKNIRGSATYY